MNRPLVARWRPGEDGAWRIVLSTFERCLGPDPAGLPRTASQAVVEAGRAVTLSLDGKLTTIESDRHASVRLAQNEEYTQFDLEPGPKGQGPAVTNLTSHGAAALIEPFETTGIALSTSFLTGRSARDMTQRFFSVRSANGSLRLRLRPTRFDLERKACEPTRWRSDGTDADVTRRFVAEVGGSSATVLVRIERVEEGRPSLRTRRAAMDLGPLDAWVRVLDLDPVTLRRAEFGTGADLSFSGKISKVSLDRKTVEIAPDDRFQIVGEVTGRWLEDGGVRLSGRADQFSRNGRLLSTTRWQRLSGELQVFLLGALGAALLVAARAVWPVIRRYGSQDLG